MQPSHYNAILALPRGAVGIRCSADALEAIDYLPPQAEQTADCALSREAERQLRAYLRDADFHFSLPLRDSGTSFQRRVWHAICAVERGRTRTYGELARELASAPRAVGQACGANPFPIVVPCHRVVAATRGFNRGLGGFANATDGWLIEIKRWLLAHEGAALP